MVKSGGWLIAFAGAIIGGSGLAYAALQIGGQLGSSNSVIGDAMIAKISAARDGETIILPAGSYGTVTFPRRMADKRVRIDASRATFTGIVMMDVGGISIDGGKIIGPGGRSYGIRLDRVHDVGIHGMTITGAHRGVVINNSRNVTIDSNTLVGLLSDGIDLALSRDITITSNTCAKFTPTLDSFDATGKLVKGGGDHPDCIQGWSRPSAAPTSGLVIERNEAHGMMQGIFLGNHVRDGVDDGGFDHVSIRDNVIDVSLPNAIVLGNGRDSIVSGNRVTTVPNSVNPRRPGSPVRAWIRVDGGERNIVCGNSVKDFPNSVPAQACPRRDAIR